MSRVLSQGAKTGHHSGYPNYETQVLDKYFFFSTHLTMKSLAVAELAPTEYVFAQVTSPKERLRNCTHLYDPSQLSILSEAHFLPVYTGSTNVCFVLC